MKQAVKLLSVATIGISFSLLGSTTFASNARGSAAGLPGGRNAGGFRGRFSGRFSNGFRNGFFAHTYYHHGGYRLWYPSNSAFVYIYAPPPYYYSYDYPPPVYDSPPLVYSSPDVHGSTPAVIYGSPQTESTQPPVVDRPLTPTATDRDTPPAPSMPQQQPATQYSPQKQSLGVADVKALVKAGISDKVIMNQIRNSHVVYHLTAVEIIDMKESQVSEKVIDFMISTSPSVSSANDLRFKLTGIMNLPDGGLVAVINGKVVDEKNYVDGAIVKRIDRDQVTLDLNGHDFVVSLF